jgi:hypothetical protein
MANDHCLIIITKKETNMTTQGTFLPREEFIASKTPQERVDFVKANPQMYAPKPQYDLIKTVIKIRLRL